MSIFQPISDEVALILCRDYLATRVAALPTASSPRMGQLIELPGQNNKQGSGPALAESHQSSATGMHFSLIPLKTPPIQQALHPAVPPFKGILHSCYTCRTSL